MSTKNLFANDDFAFFSINMKTSEAVVRLFLAATFMGVLLVEPSAGYKILPVIASVYLFTTAITRWEPLYAWMGPNPMNMEISQLLKHGNDGELRRDISGGQSVRAANDENHKVRETKDSA